MSNSRILSNLPSNLANNKGNILFVDYTGSIIWEHNYAFDTANTGVVQAQGAFLQANNAYAAANNITPQLGPAFGRANAAYDQANTGISQAQSAFLQANNAYAAANNITPQLGPSFNRANAAYDKANTGTLQAQGAFSQANNAYSQANTGVVQAQGAFSQANSAYSSANTKFSSSGGIINGNVNITGSLQVDANLIISGNVTAINANNLSVEDNMIYLNSGSNVANPDLGFAGNYNDGTYHHTGFFRDATDGVWKVFDNYQPEPDASVYIDTSNSTFRIADFQANNITGNTFSGTSNNTTYFAGNPSSYYINLSSTGISQAQSAFLQANNAYSNSNTKFNSSGGTISGNVTITGAVTIAANTPIKLPVGNTTQRSSNTNGLFWYNTDIGGFEGYTISGWGPIGGSIYVANTAPPNPQQGTPWWNTDAGKLLLYYNDGTNNQWVEASPNQAGLLARPVRQSFTATANQTSFTIDGGYSPGLVDVFLNGSKLVNGNDVLVSSGTSVILTAGAYAGSVLDVVGLNSTALASVVPITGGTMTGPLNTTSLVVYGNTTSNNITSSNNITYSGTLIGGNGIIDIGSGKIYKDANGNVGIGTSSPASILHVEGAGANFYLKSNNTTDSVVRMFVNGSERGAIRANSSSYMSFDTAGTTRMTIDPSGNLGIGTTTPAAGVKLNISDAKAKIQVTSTTGTNAGYMTFSNTGGNLYFGIDNSAGTDFSAAYAGVMWQGGAYPLVFATSNTERMRLDSSGNLGLGVTPSGWTSNFRAIQISSISALYQDSVANTILSNNQINISNINRYLATAAASLYLQNSGAHKWYNAPSGTAGDAITFNQAMTLDASGNLGVGSTSPVSRFEVAGSTPTVSVTPTTQNQATGINLRVLNAGTYGAARIEAINTSTYDSNLLFYTNTSSSTTLVERARIDSSGNLLVGGAYIDPIGSRVNSFTWRPAGITVRQSGTNQFGISSTSGTQITWYTDNGTNYVGAGTITSSGSSTAYNTSSDQRLKENIVDAPNALSSINAIKVRSFDWKSDGSHSEYGYIAQELLEVAAEAVHIPDDPEEMMGVDFGKLTPRLVKAIQELSAQNQVLEARLAKLEEK